MKVNTPDSNLFPSIGEILRTRKNMNPVDAFVPEHISRLMSGDELCNFLEDVKHRSCLRNLSFILGMLDHDTLPLGGERSVSAVE